VNEKIARLGIGAVSAHVIRAAFRYSALNGMPIIVMATQNQIDENGGYVMTLPNFSAQAEILCKEHAGCNVILARDHLKPENLSSDGVEHLKESISILRANGIRLIHLDFGEFAHTKAQSLSVLDSVVAWLKSRHNGTFVEISTTLDDHAEYAENLIDDLGRLSDINPDFIVLPTGSKVRNGTQVGVFSGELAARTGALAHELGINLKEHNADFLSKTDVSLRDGIVDAFNIAPECGLLQTKLTLSLAETYGIDYRPFLVEAYKSHQWLKWVTPDFDDKELCSILAGHYVFQGENYRRLIDTIGKYCSFNDQLDRRLFEVFDRYS
jgi:hypothetical protein